MINLDVYGVKFQDFEKQYTIRISNIFWGHINNLTKNSLASENLFYTNWDVEFKQEKDQKKTNVA